MPADRLILIDGHGVMYRAFHAIPGLCTSAGQPTNAVFGMVRLLRQIRSRLYRRIGQ